MMPGSEHAVIIRNNKASTGRIQLQGREEGNTRAWEGHTAYYFRVPCKLLDSTDHTPTITPTYPQSHTYTHPHHTHTHTHLCYGKPKRTRGCLTHLKTMMAAERCRVMYDATKVR